MKEIEVATNGRFRGACRLDQLVQRNKAALADDFRQALTSFFRKEKGHRLRSFLYLSQSVYPLLCRFQSISLKFCYEEWGISARNLVREGFSDHKDDVSLSRYAVLSPSPVTTSRTTLKVE